MQRRPGCETLPIGGERWSAAARGDFQFQPHSALGAADGRAAASSPWGCPTIFPGFSPAAIPSHCPSGTRHQRSASTPTSTSLCLGDPLFDPTWSCSAADANDLASQRAAASGNGGGASPSQDTTGLSHGALDSQAFLMNRVADSGPGPLRHTSADQALLQALAAEHAAFALQQQQQQQLYHQLQINYAHQQQSLHHMQSLSGSSLSRSPVHSRMPSSCGGTVHGHRSGVQSGVSSTGHSRDSSMSAAVPPGSYAQRSTLGLSLPPRPHTAHFAAISGTGSCGASGATRRHVPPAPTPGVLAARVPSQGSMDDNVDWDSEGVSGTAGVI